MSDGNAWGRCAQGHAHWGSHGAAGLLPFHTDAEGRMRVLLQLRAWWGSGGGTWGMFGGGRHRGEDRIAAALRETAEECTLDLDQVRLVGMRVDDHGGWDYTTVIGWVPELLPVAAASSETKDAEWVPVEEVADRRLFEPFGDKWEDQLRSLARVEVIVDVANVMGSRPDGWWRDRAGAAERLRDSLAPLPERGVVGMPAGMYAFDRCFPELTLVAEGAAKGLTSGGTGLRVVAAEGSGDDAIVAEAARPAPGAVRLVVTADRELRARCQAVGASVVGPRWLLDQV